MSGERNRERELRKQILKNSMTEAPEETKEKPKLPPWLRWVVLAVAIVALIGGLVFLWLRSRKAYESVESQWAVTMTDTTFSHFVEMGGGLVRYSRDGVAFYDKNGDMVWNQSYEMVEPVVAVNGNYMAIADQRGYQIYLFDKSGPVGQAKTNLPISRVTVAGNGVSAAILEDTTANYINFFAKDGKKLDIEVKTLLSGDGYPVDIALSENGTLLTAAFVYLEDGLMKNKVVFYNFSEAGKNIVHRIVGGFHQYEQALVPDVHMLGQKAAVAFADDRISFYSLKNEVSPVLVKEIKPEKEIRSVFYSGSHVGVILADPVNVSRKTLAVYNSQGDTVFETETEMGYTQAAFTGKFVVLYNNAECEIYTVDGLLRYRGELVGSISRLANLEGTWVQVGGQEMKKLKFR